MDETLRFFMKEDCAGFRLIHNAIACTGLFEPKDGTGPAAFEPEPALDLLDTLDTVENTLSSRFEKLNRLAAEETMTVRDVAAAEIGRLRAEWLDIVEKVRRACAEHPIDRDVKAGLSAVLQAAAVQPAHTRLAEILVATELPVRLTAAALRIVNHDRALETI